VTKDCVDAATPGDPITFSGTVTNTGDVLLVDVTVTDDHAGQVLGPISLAPGASAPYNGQYNPTESPSMNEVTAAGTEELFGVKGTTVYDWADDTCVVLTHPGISVVKECSDAAAGQPIPFWGTVYNTGDVELRDVTVTDDHAGLVLGPITLGVGGSQSFSGSYMPTDSPSTNEVTAEGTPYLFGVAIGAPISATDDATCEVAGCALSPGFWKGGEGVQKWDEECDPAAAVCCFTTDTVFPWLDPSLAGKTYLEVLNLPVKGDVTIQLAFKYIAAKLNYCYFGPPPDISSLLTAVEAELAVHPVGSNPKGADAAVAKGLLDDLNTYFRTTGEEFCPPTGDIGECPLG